MKRYYAIHSAFTGSQSQTGPIVEWSRSVHGAKFSHKHGEAQVLDCWTCASVPGCKVAFHDTQINGATFMLQRSCGKYPLSNKLKGVPDAVEAAKKLRSIQTFGGMLVCGMGLGKTYTSLLFLMNYILHVPKTKQHRPHLILVPAGVVLSQWVEALKLFPAIRVLYMHGEKPTDPVLARNWISPLAMKEAPGKLTNWPPYLRYIWDTKDPQASSAVLLSSPETWQRRTLQEHKLDDERGGTTITHSSRVAGKFKVVLLDEGHRFRYQDTKIFAGVYQLQADIYWFLTGTPMQNSAMVRIFKLV